jgi:hypothetical protein
MKRRPRIADPIASPAGVRRVLDTLREISPFHIPATDRKVFTLLNAVRHVGRYKATDKLGNIRRASGEIRPGRPPRG